MNRYFRNTVYALAVALLLPFSMTGAAQAQTTAPVQADITPAMQLLVNQALVGTDAEVLVAIRALALANPSFAAAIAGSAATQKPALAAQVAGTVANAVPAAAVAVTQTVVAVAPAAATAIAAAVSVAVPAQAAAIQNVATLTASLADVVPAAGDNATPVFVVEADTGIVVISESEITS